jgi:hypothetical protein
MSYTINNHNVVDLETGEILGPVVEAGAIASQDALELVLERIQNQAAQVSAEQIRLKAIQEQAEKTLKRKSGYLNYLKAVYESPIEQYAKARLAHTGKKSIQTPFGSVNFRTLKGGLKVVDPDQALMFAKLAKWENAIKTTEKFLISALTEKQLFDLGDNVPDGFELAPERESMTIKTGVE